MNDRIVDEIVARLRERYGSLAAPRFGFVQEMMTADPYASLVQRLIDDFDCQDETEPNDDVSFGYLLTNRRGAWVLRVSMVGPYAVLLRLRDGGVADVVESGGAGITEDERRLLRALKTEGIRALGRETLDEPISLALSNTSPGKVRVFQALFTDTDVLPWDRCAAATR